MTNEEMEKLLKELRYNRQMQKKRLYDQARRQTLRDASGKASK